MLLLSKSSHSFEVSRASATRDRIDTGERDAGTRRSKLICILAIPMHGDSDSPFWLQFTRHESLFQPQFTNSKKPLTSLTNCTFSPSCWGPETFGTSKRSFSPTSASFYDDRGDSCAGNDKRDDLVSHNRRHRCFRERDASHKRA